MSIVGSLISAGGSLLGGLMGGSPSSGKAAKAVRRQTEAGIMGQAAGARAAAEEFGFNPLTLLGVSTPVAPANAGQSGVGASIADAAMILGQGLINNADKQRVAGLEATVAKQAKKLNDYQLRPKTPGPIQTRQASITAGKAIAPVYLKEPDPLMSGRAADPELVQGPRPAVKVFNTQANKWAWLDKGVADRLGVPHGGTMLAEDYEAIHGDVGSEFINTPNTANEVLGYGVTYPAKPDTTKNPKFKSSEKKRHKQIVDELNAARGAWEY